MKYHPAFVLVFGLLAGCTTADGERTTRPEATGTSSQEDLAHKALEYREQARVLRDMAERREAEAALQSQELGPDHESVQRKRKLAEELRNKADEAEATARDLQRQVPHGMVQ